MLDGLPEAQDRRARWVLARLGVEIGGEPDDPPETVFAPRWRDMDYPASKFCAMRRAMGPWTIQGNERDPDGVLAITLSDPRSRAMRLRIGFEPEPDGRISSLSLARPIPPGITIRVAGTKDFEQIVCLEQACPIDLGNGRSIETRRANFAAHLRLQGDTRLWVAESDGRIVALQWQTLRKLRLANREMHIGHTQLALVHPSERGAGLNQVFFRWHQEEVQPLLDTFTAHQDAGNAASRSSFGVGDHLNWRRQVQQVAIACDPTAPSVGRAAMPADASQLAALKNAAHAADAMFAPAEASTFEERLNRAPEAYSWKDVLVGRGAFVGVWHSGETTVVRDAAGGAETKTLAAVLDYGFEGEAGLGELVALIHAAGARAARSGATHLSLYTSEGSNAGAALGALSANVDRFMFRTGIPEPPPTERPGLYTDPIYV